MNTMLSLFKKDPLKKLNKQYKEKLAEALKYQRNGDIKTYSFLSREADDLLKQIEALEAEKV